MSVKGKAAESPSSKKTQPTKQVSMKGGDTTAKEVPARLPGMQDAGIHDLDQAALDYAEGRDERMALGKKEVELKTKLIALMHAHGKTVYKYEDIEIELITEKEKVKVRIRKDDEEE